MHRLTHPRAQHRSGPLKSTQTSCVKGSFANLKQLLECRGLLGSLQGWRLAGAIFELSLCHILERQCLLEGSFYVIGALAFVAVARGQLFVAWLWWLVGLLLSGPIGLVPNRERVLKQLGYHPQVTVKGSRPRCSYCERGLLDFIFIVTA